MTKGIMSAEDDKAVVRDALLLQGVPLPEGLPAVVHLLPDGGLREVLPAVIRQIAEVPEQGAPHLLTEAVAEHRPVQRLVREHNVARLLYHLLFIHKEETFLVREITKIMKRIKLIRKDDVKAGQELTKTIKDRMRGAVGLLQQALFTTVTVCAMVLTG